MITCSYIQAGLKKTRMFLRVDNFVTVGGKTVLDMSNVSKLCLDKKYDTR